MLNISLLTSEIYVHKQIVPHLPTGTGDVIHDILVYVKYMLSSPPRVSPLYVLFVTQIPTYYVTIYRTQRNSVERRIPLLPFSVCSSKSCSLVSELFDLIIIIINVNCIPEVSQLFPIHFTRQITVFW